MSYLRGISRGKCILRCVRYVTFRRVAYFDRDCHHLIIRSSSSSSVFLGGIYDFDYANARLVDIKEQGHILN